MPGWATESQLTPTATGRTVQTTDPTRRHLRFVYDLAGRLEQQKAFTPVTTSAGYLAKATTIRFTYTTRRCSPPSVPVRQYVTHTYGTMRTPER